VVVGLSVADCVADGEGVALAGEEEEAVGVAEEVAASGDALDADAAVATDVVVLTAGAPPVVVGPHAVIRANAATASPATIRAMGVRTITTPS